MNSLRESKIERYFKDAIKRVGGRSFKWVSPGFTGVPDQIAICRGKAWLVEFKSPTGQLSRQQVFVHRMLRRLGMTVWIVDSKPGADALIEIIKHGRAV